MEGPRRILILNEDDANRDFIKASLELRGFEVIVAADGPAVLHCIADGSADVVLLHQAVSGSDRVGVCRAIRNHLKRWDLPIGLITARQDQELRILGTEAGADDFLLKPFDEVELLARVQSLLKLKAYHDLRARQHQAFEEELDRTRSQLLHFERLVGLGTIAAGVGHELNNVAAVLMHTVHFIRERADQDLPPEPEDLSALIRGVEHLAAHARNLLHAGFSGIDRPQKIDVTELAAAVVSMLQAAGKLKGVEVVIDAPDRPITREFPRMRLEQILVNLISNAVDAVLEAARSPQLVRIGVAADTGTRTLRCEVEDTGTGISDDTLPCVFEPYFTTKARDKGAGLGLTVVKHLIEAAGGTIAIQSRLGEGTMVRFELPFVNTAPSRGRPV